GAPSPPDDVAEHAARWGPGRPRLYATAAERSRAYRERQRSRASEQERREQSILTAAELLAQSVTEAFRRGVPGLRQVVNADVRGHARGDTPAILANLVRYFRRLR